MKCLNLILVFFFTIKAQALIPLESLVLGDLSRKYRKDLTQALKYIFQSRGNLKVEHKRSLSFYRGFIEEGENLASFCRTDHRINYVDVWKKNEVKRAVISTLQYIGLDLLARALPKYAKFFEFSEQEFKNLVNRLTGNYCSKNISIISIKQLAKNILFNFTFNTPFILPDIQGNNLFSPKLMELNTVDQVKENEFIQSIKLFKVFCSWGNDVDNLRLLVPLLNNPIIMAFLIRQMTNRRFNWDLVNNEISLRRELQTIQVLCRGAICRKVNHEKFNDLIPRSLGSRNLTMDFKRLYCEQFKNAPYRIKNQEPKILKMIKASKPADESLLVGQFLSLLTGIPDLFVRANKFSDASEFLKFSFQDSWENWARHFLKKMGEDLYFEEPLTLEVVSRKHYFHEFSPRFAVEFDINKGEIDRSVEMVGKLNLSFSLELSKSYLSWAREQWPSVLRESTRKQRKRILKNFVKRIEDQVLSNRKKFILPPWTGKLEELIAKELLTQLALYEGNYFENLKREKVKIPIGLNYAPFALKYIHLKSILK
jgi:hypothetical protein